jgi:osmotically-inducible protein OsmY
MRRRLKNRVLQALALEPRVDAAKLDIDVRDGRVTLAGVVDDEIEKWVTKYVAEHVPGVRSVVDKLEIEKSCRAEARQERTNDNLLGRILNALYWDLIVPHERIMVAHEDGWITLTGVVDHPYQKTAAEADVRLFQEVVGVNNKIIVEAAV